MFGLGRDPDLPQVTLWRDFEEPVQLPTVQSGDLKFRNNLSRITWLHVFSFLAGFHPVVKVLLEHGADPNSVATDWELTPLHVTRTPETARLLLDYKAEVDVKDRNGCTPLVQATVNDHHSVVEVLLAHGADPNISPMSNFSLDLHTNEQSSPLHHATSAETAELLIAKGAEVNAENWGGETPLFTATRWNRHSVVRVLLAHGADLNIRDIEQISPLHQATSAEIAELLILKGADVNAKANNGNTPLFDAIENDHRSVIHVLLAHGADPNITHEDGRSPLFVATEKSIHSVVEVLLTHGADPNITHEDGRSPLFVATEKNIHSVVEVLLTHGADPNMLDYNETSPLHQVQSAKTAELLVQKNAEVNAKSRDGTTPLLIATQKDRHSVVDVLLAHGADPNITDWSGRSPLLVATEKNHHSVVDVLLAHGATPNGRAEECPLYQAQSLETAVLLIEKGAILNSSFLRESVFYEKFFTNEKALASILSAHKARNGNLDERNAEGNTLLHLCCEWGNEVAVKCILNEGARQDLRNNEGKTAYEIAISKRYVHVASHFPHYLSSSFLNSTESRFEQEFEILSGIGEGGYGKVYKVKKKADGKEYALKCVTISGDSEKMQRSLREVRGAMQLGRHFMGKDYIVECYDAWIEEREDVGKEQNALYSASSTTAETWGELMRRRKRLEENKKLQEGGQKSQEGIEETPEVNPETERTEPQGGHQLLNQPKHLSKTFKLFIQMELMDQSLEDFIRKRNEGYNWDGEQLSAQDLWITQRIFMKIVPAVEFMHQNGYIHRDLKPQNILLSADPLIRWTYKVKLADLGISVQLQERNVETGTRTAHQGTRFYAAPEQYNSPFEEPSYYGAEVDVYALGVILVDILLPLSPVQRMRANDLLRLPRKKIPDEVKAVLPSDELDCLRKMVDKDPKGLFLDVQTLDSATRQEDAAAARRAPHGRQGAPDHQAVATRRIPPARRRCIQAPPGLDAGHRPAPPPLLTSQLSPRYFLSSNREPFNPGPCGLPVSNLSYDVGGE
ncbi:unnamed protein product [Cyprideis torosa]|uniref:Uncharacterized protein n=1 Tax=Cyprideis torosa TaxID=163714 RepID=A0A7R8ZU86_9CRUS|nr:unnamed protein product [Cyprideis torosa]CAG0899821.1 unnamed protein product [Cyprideis torosa]